MQILGFLLLQQRKSKQLPSGINVTSDRSRSISTQDGAVEKSRRDDKVKVSGEENVHALEKFMGWTSLTLPCGNYWIDL